MKNTYKVVMVVLKECIWYEVIRETRNYTYILCGSNIVRVHFSDIADYSCRFCK